MSEALRAYKAELFKALGHPTRIRILELAKGYYGTKHNCFRIAELQVERSLAYAFGWMVHIVGDSLIKSIRAGIKMQLLDGTYTPRNRPVQDLFTFHKLGIAERAAPWATWFDEMAATPVEPIQPHYMRIGEKRGPRCRLTNTK